MIKHNKYNNIFTYLSVINLNDPVPIFSYYLAQYWSINTEKYRAQSVYTLLTLNVLYAIGI